MRDRRAAGAVGWRQSGCSRYLAHLVIGASMAAAAPEAISTAPMATLPLLLVPAFLVPPFLMLHAATLMQSRRIARSRA